MKGRHHIVIETESIKFAFDVRRNITVLQGDSATGKTTLIDILQEYSTKGSGRGIRLESDVACYVFSGSEERWEYELKGLSGGVVFIDEDYRFIHSKEFAAYLAQADNYFVLIGRKPFHNLPYSINEIYGIRTSGKYHFPEQIYHEFYPIYSDIPAPAGTDKKAMILVEDKEAGYQFFKELAGDERCRSADGNANLFPRLLELESTEELLIIADGAAFGAYVEKMVRYSSVKSHIALYFPESFEWMVLKSDVIKDAEISEILHHPEDYIDSTEYVSWERFFTALLIERTKNMPYMRYSKSDLASFYKRQNAERIVAVMPEVIRKMI